MCGIGWQFSRRTPPELKTGYIAGWSFLRSILVNSLELHSLYFSREISVAGKYPKFLSDVCLASPEFFPFWPQPWTDFVGPISAQLGFALGYYCQWRSKIEAIGRSGAIG